MSRYTGPTPPATLPLDRADVPAEYEGHPQFVAWGWRVRKGSWTKPPINPATGANAESDDPSTWGTADEAFAARDRLGLDGVGFVVTEVDDFSFIDLDDSRNPATGVIAPWAMAIVRRIPSRWEISPSGTGLKGLVRGRFPENKMPKVGAGKAELFSSGKFTTLSGRHLEGTPATINACQPELDGLYADLVGRVAPPLRPSLPPAIDLDDEAILERVRRMPKGRALHDAADAGGYPSGSEADLALCNAYVAGGATDEDQLDRLFRSSAWYPDRAEKWDRDDYRRRTTAKALDGTVRPMPTMTRRPNPHLAGLPPTEGATADDDLPDDPTALKKLIVARLAQLDLLQAQVDDLKTENARLRDANQKLSLLQSKTMAAFRSKNLGAEKATGIAIAFELQNQRSAHPDRSEFVIPYARIADQAGLSESTVGAHVKERLDPLGLWDRRTRFVPERVDQETGEILPAKNQTVFVPKVDPLGILDVLATAQPPSGKAKNNWGGKADRGAVCSKHPTAGVVKRVSYHCAECDTVLHQEPDQPQDAAPPGPTPQDAGLVDDDHAPDAGASVGANGAARVTYPSVDNHYRGPNGRVCHNDASPSISRDEDAGTTVAAAFQRGQGLPGMPSESPPDRWTG